MKLSMWQAPVDGNIGKAILPQCKASALSNPAAGSEMVWYCLHISTKFFLYSLSKFSHFQIYSKLSPIKYVYMGRDNWFWSVDRSVCKAGWGNDLNHQSKDNSAGNYNPATLYARQTVLFINSVKVALKKVFPSSSFLDM